MAITWEKILFEGRVVTLGDGSTLATSAAPVADAEIANKKYVDDNAGGLTQAQILARAFLR